MGDGKAGHGSELLTLNEAAALLRLKPSTLRDWVLKRRISFVKVGRLVRIQRATVDALIAANTVPAREGSQTVGKAA